MSDALRLEVTHVPETYRFVIAVDGEVGGYTKYRPGPGIRAFVHTEIDERFQGQGLGSRLVSQALDATRAEGLLVEPHCPYVRSFIAKHPVYLDLVPADRRDEFHLSSSSSPFGGV